MGYRKLGRTASHRKAMLRNLVTALMVHGRIETTVTRAKEVRSIAEKMITLGKKGDLTARRTAAKYIQPVAVETAEGKTQLALKKLFEEVAPKYQDRNGGYTRILRVGPRHGDAAETAIIELV
ncbi:50S ribosomal protein L17 [Gemelliphila asaccharolytica]|jgi:hypothetical protein|uniref:Large ribosomal subunit protein bL17 n=1 Tax=Gemelliphila asaccharolytica TaxID=502393 RepID=A0ABR5TKQ6_9BACL|nr:50S ribosomal protein L17 [Gemella asaccharolytica]KXB56632.1 ribosomal protein L17 [Gemella asaccharolytica]